MQIKSIQNSEACTEQRDDDTDHSTTVMKNSTTDGEYSHSSFYGERRLSGDIAKLSEDLMEREVQRNMIGDRVRRLRESLLTSRRINEHALEEEEQRDDVATRTPPPTKSARLLAEVGRVNPFIPRLPDNPEKPPTISTTSEDPIALSCVLEVKEEEIKKLRSELDQLQKERATVNKGSEKRDTAASSNKIIELEQQLKSKMDHIDVLELRLTAKDRTIKRLHDHMTTLNRQKLELEVKLEFHDWKFSSYEKYQKDIEKEGLHRNRGPEEGKDSIESSNQENHDSPQHSFADFLLELEKLEQHYVTARQESTEQIAKIQQERDTYLEKLNTMESTISKSSQSMSTDNEFGVTSPLRGERMKLLQTENAEYNRLVTSLRWQVETLTRSNEKKEKHFELERSILTRKNHCLETKASALQSDLKALSGTLDAPEKSRYYRMLDSSLDDYIAEISRMEERLRTKDRIINSLRTKTVDHRLAIAQTVDQQQQESSLALPQE